MSDEEYFGDRRKALEDEFFRRTEKQQLEKLRQQKARDEMRQLLQSMSGITDTAILDKLVELNFSAETLSALSLTPLVEVAWADGKMEDKERQAILQAAAESGVQEGSAAHALLDSWLSERPDKTLMQTWVEFVQGLREVMTAEQFTLLKNQLLHRSRGVAEAAGGILGLGSKVSKEEEEVLERLAQAFSD